MIDPADDGITLPLPVTAPCPHSVRYAGDAGMFTAHLIQDLMGDWFIMRSWGQARKLVASVDEGIVELAKISKTLEKKGCSPVPLLQSGLFA